MAVRSRLAIFGTFLAAAVLLVGPPCFVASKGRLPALQPSIETAAAAPIQPAGNKASKQLQEEIEENSAFGVSRAALSVLAALLVALAPAAETQAARTGGRIGSSAPSRQEQRKPPPAARQAMEPPKVINKTTVVQKTVVVPPPPPPVIVASPPMITPFGMGVAPVVVAPPPTVGDIIIGAAVNGAINSTINSTIPRGPSTTDRIMENQIRQDERQLDRQASQIDDLQRELRELKK